MTKSSFLMISIVAMILFGISTGAAYKWRQMRDDREATAEGPSLMPFSESPPTPANTEPAPPEEPVVENMSDVPIGVRPRHVEGSEDQRELAEKQRSGLAAIARKEQELKSKEERVKLIHNDILEQQEKVNALRQELDKELAEHVKSVETYFEKMEATGGQAADLDDLKGPGGEGDLDMLSVEGKRKLKRMAAEYDTMSAESVAHIFRQLHRGGNTETAVRLLDVMKERQVGKVKEVFKESDPGLAADLDRQRLEATEQPAEADATNQ